MLCNFFNNSAQKFKYLKPILGVLSIHSSICNRKQLTLCIDRNSRKEDAFVRCFKMSAVKTKECTTISETHSAGSITDKYTMKSILRSDVEVNNAVRISLFDISTVFRH